MDNYVLLCLSITLILVILILLLSFLKKSSNKEDGAEPVREPVQRRQVAQIAGGVRRRGAGQRMQRAQQAVDSDDEDDGLPDIAMPEGKVGAKKLKKLQDKAEKRAQREAEFQEREERKKREEMREEQRKKEEQRQEAIEKAQEEEERKRKEEQERRDHEEYLKLKASFVVEEEGLDEAAQNRDERSLLQEFISYIQEMKVIMLEDLAAHFKIKTQDVIDRIQSLQEDGRLTGVLDDRGKFIYITEEEYEAVARFIKQRGRVSISDLAESSNRLINMTPDNQEVHKALVADT